MIDANEIVGRRDILLVTFDTLRFDVAQDEWRAGRTPNLARVLPKTGWEKRHSPGNFTFASHAAFFAGFLPTPAEPISPGAPKAERLFAAKFPGSETTGAGTFVFDAPDIVTGLAQHGYHTVCIGGVGFFNRQTPLGRVLPSLFQESYWRRELGVTDPRSAEHQVDIAVEILHRTTSDRRIFLFINISAIHQPNCFYLHGAKTDTLESHAAALQYVDLQLGRLVDCLERRGSTLGIFCSDHGTAYGEDGYHGHRIAHSVVWTVPYAEFLIGGEANA